MKNETAKNRKGKFGLSGGILLLTLCLTGCSTLPGLAFAADKEGIKAFPGALGWAAFTPGGRGGKIIRVTNLNTDGPGSFAEAVAQKGKRIVVFEVGGVIDLGKDSIRITEPFLTIAGQTAPDPGITFIRGEILVRDTHDVIIRHIRVRTGEAGAAKRSGWNSDGISLWRSHNVIVDHCSCAWATDENLSASGPQFDGETVEDWRKSTSHRVTFSNCIVAEGLSHSTHRKGEHSKGGLIHDNATEIAIIGNLYACNKQRNPLFKGGVHGIVANNLISNPGNRAIHYGLVASEWKERPYQTGLMSIVGNVMEYGPDTIHSVPLFSFTYDGPVEVFMEDNLIVRIAGVSTGMFGGEDSRGKCTLVDKAPVWPDGFKAMPCSETKDYVLKNAGARPWDRDSIDKRILRNVINQVGKIIDSEEEVGGYPKMRETRAPFNPDEWNLDTMERKS